MRNIVIQDEFSERDIRPGVEAAEYYSLVEKESKLFFSDNQSLKKCPGCFSSSFVPAFSKFSFQYVECKGCGTVFMNPRPSQKAIDLFYKESKAALFWREHFLKVSGDQRQDHIYIPRVNWIVGAVRDQQMKVSKYLDVHSKYKNMLTLFKERLGFQKGYLYRSESIEGEPEEFQSIASFENEGLGIDIVTLFETIERVADPDCLIKEISKNILLNGLIFLTTSSIDGFEHQVLWDKSKNIFPPDHMTLLSKLGILQLFKRNGFEILELSTPGILDVDIASNQVVKEGEPKTHRFIEKILASDDVELKLDFQRFLQRNRLSSHTRIVCKKVDSTL